MTEAVRVTELHKAFRAGRRRIAALSGVSLSIEEGECLAIVGESGCGKSTLARLLVGIEAPDSGAVRVFGLPTQPSKHSERQRVARLCQMVFQNPYASLNPRHRVGRIIEEPLIIHQAAIARDVNGECANSYKPLGSPMIASNSSHTNCQVDNDSVWALRVL